MSIASLKAPAGRPRSSIAARTTSSTEHHSRWGSAASASRRERSSRSSISRDRRCASTPTASASSPRSASVRLGERKASALVRIAVSGERRSCETLRRSAVLITSLRRSAAVSTTSACSPSRSSAAASSASSDGATRACTRRSVASGAPAGSTSVPIWREPSRSGKTTLRSPASTARSSIAALVSAERPREPLADRRQRLLQPSAAAQQQPRQLGRQVGLAAALVGLQRPAARDLRERAGARGGDEEDRQRDPVLAVGDREAPGRRDVEEVEDQRARPARSRAPATRPRPSRRRAPPAGRRPRARARARRP